MCFLKDDSAAVRIDGKSVQIDAERLIRKQLSWRGRRWELHPALCQGEAGPERQGRILRGEPQDLLLERHADWEHLWVQSDSQVEHLTVLVGRGAVY